MSLAHLDTRPTGTVSPIARPVASAAQAAEAPTAHLRAVPSGTEARGFVLYVGIDEDKAAADGTDLSTIEWTRGAYDLAGLSNVYTGNDARARIVLNALRDTVNDPSTIRALGFCASVTHAQYMARVFTGKKVCFLVDSWYVKYPLIAFVLRAILRP